MQLRCNLQCTGFFRFLCWKKKTVHKVLQVLAQVVISKGLETPAGTRVRVRRVGVGVQIVRPHINPYP